MNKVSIIWFFTAVTSITDLFSQNNSVLGKWYMVNRSGLIEMNITSDSIKTRELFTDFRPKGKPEKAQSIDKIATYGDKTFIVTRKITDSTKFSVMTIIDFQLDKYFKVAWNTLDTSINNIEKLIELHKGDNRQLLGFYSYSENYLDTLKNLNPIENMSVNDFKKYLTIYLQKLKNDEKTIEKYNLGYSAASYNFQTITASLYELRYNPLQNIRTVDKIYKQFYDDPDIKKLLEDSKR
jgi:hypothetical protein